MSLPESSAERREELGSIRVAILGSGDPYDVKLFSGSTRNMTLALETVFGGATVIRRPRPAWFAKVRSVVRRATAGRVDIYYSRFLAARHARALWPELDAARPDLVFSIANSSLTAELAKRYHVIHLSDATFALMRNFYPAFADLGRRWARAGDRMEQDAIRRSRFVSVSSPWAARSVIEDYGADSAQVLTQPWGCNIAHIPADQVSRHDAGQERCRLLFIGVDWMRKGGDIVLETARLLRARGFDFHLDLVGSAPADAVDSEDVTIHGFLHKGVSDEYQKLLSLLQGASLLFLPTRQDCTPMVFAEANAYGVPSLARDVGGVSGVIEDGVNGLVLDAEATAEDFADQIIALWSDPARYSALRRDARLAYETRLNWDCWGTAIRSATEHLADGPFTGTGEIDERV